MYTYSKWQHFLKILEVNEKYIKQVSILLILKIMLQVVWYSDNP